MRLGRFQRRRAVSPGGEGGYILIVLMLMLALFILALTMVAPYEVQQIRRDQEDEVVHRGAQYARAIKKYFKKTGAYPNSLEQLEKTNNIRFLRKRYKDPLTPDGQWKLLHTADLLQGGARSLLPGSSDPTAVARVTQTAQSSGLIDTGIGTATTGGSGGQQGSVTGDTSGAQGTGSSPGPLGQPPGIGGQAFGGGAIVGVASMSGKKSIREFADKNHYKDWLFVYNPGFDRGGLIVGPATGKTFGGVAGNMQGIPGAAQPGQFGQFGPAPAQGMPGNFGPTSPTGPANQLPQQQ